MFKTYFETPAYLVTLAPRNEMNKVTLSLITGTYFKQGTCSFINYRNQGCFPHSCDLLFPVDIFIFWHFSSFHFKSILMLFEASEFIKQSIHCLIPDINSCISQTPSSRIICTHLSRRSRWECSVKLCVTRV